MFWIYLKSVFLNFLKITDNLPLRKNYFQKKNITFNVFTRYFHFCTLTIFLSFMELSPQGNKLARSVTDAEEWRSAAAQVIERFFGQITYLPMTNSEHSSAEVTPSRASIMVNRDPVRSLQQSLFVRFHLFATFLPTIRHAKNVHVPTNVRSGINKYFERLSNLCTVQSIQGMFRKI